MTGNHNGRWLFVITTTIAVVLKIEENCNSPAQKSIQTNLAKVKNERKREREDNNKSLCFQLISVWLVIAKWKYLRLERKNFETSLQWLLCVLLFGRSSNVNVCCCFILSSTIYFSFAKCPFRLFVPRNISTLKTRAFTFLRFVIFPRKKTLNELPWVFSNDFVDCFCFVLSLL